MIINRAIWLALFAIGLCFLGLFVMALDSWALSRALPGHEMYCRGTMVADVPRTRAPLCFALWFTEARSWVFYARDMLLQVNHGRYAHQVLRTVDVAFYVIGAAAAGLALAFVWANAMTRLTLSTIAGWYSLMHGLSHFLGTRSGRRIA